MWGVPWAGPVEGDSACAYDLGRCAEMLRISGWDGVPGGETAVADALASTGAWVVAACRACFAGFCTFSARGELAAESYYIRHAIMWHDITREKERDRGKTEEEPKEKIFL